MCCRNGRSKTDAVYIVQLFDGNPVKIPLSDSIRPLYKAHTHTFSRTHSENVEHAHLLDVTHKLVATHTHCIEVRVSKCLIVGVMPYGWLPNEITLPT